ncbi:MAG: phosphatidate cytidylyltransferase [Syntrophaceticus sp.]|nr:phosphatidate cytidylyltransferase [Syntrophaceticus sp.]MDD3313897.1 phosphatidate cytidylyltransferase [Syntrophaceticus sp.]MDD4358975.1 phosphatidate cytidylyltransferase [Syntrophaceticus sp.]MDD4782201.1 phosphatidate cytidylyltransferase [Syntrophaceticus sp.]
MDLFWQRIISALIGIPVIILFIYLGGLPLLLFIIVLAFFCAYELQRILRRIDLQVPWLPFYGSALLFPLLAYFAPDGHEYEYLFFGVIFLLIMHMMLLVFDYPRLGVSDLAASYLGSGYISLLLSHFILIRNLRPFGLQYLLLVIILTWACDIGAYFIGRLFGSRALCPKLSPGKTWEGSAGGIIFCVVTAAVFQVICPILTLQKIILLAIIIGFVAQIGDLVESSLKRMGEIKDSGNIIPGHGGVLDRLDSILFTGPVAYLCIKILLP